MISLTPWLQHLEQQIPLVRKGVESEPVHQLRVSAGRLSVWLELSGRRMLRDDLRWLRRSAGLVRDLDVLLERDLPPAWARALAAERELRRRELLHHLADPRLSSLVAALTLVPDLEDSTARDALARFKRRVLKAGRGLKRDETDARALHRLRRAVRRLRYALEWLGEDMDALKDLQDAFGELNNLAVGLRQLDSPAAPNGLASERVALELEFDERRTHAIAAWKQQRSRIANL